jgi:flagellar protein FliS
MLPYAREHHLATSVMTASREKLHLMLIEGALRLAERALEARRAGKEEAAFNAVLRSREIVNELICGIKHDGPDELTSRIAAIYVFIFRRLVDAGYPRQQQPLEEVIRILQIERETWQLLCRQSASEARPSEGAPPTEPVGHAPHWPNFADLSQGSLSLEV